jgi:hypothetical protein
MRIVDAINEKVENRYEYGIYRLSNGKVFPKIFKSRPEAKQFLKRRSPDEWGLCRRKVGEWEPDEED